MAGVEGAPLYLVNGKWVTGAEKDYAQSVASGNQTPINSNGVSYMTDQPAGSTGGSYGGITSATGGSKTGGYVDGVNGASWATPQGGSGSFLNPGVQATGSTNGTQSFGGQTYVPTPTNGYVSQAEYDRERTMDINAKAQADAEQRRLGYLSQVVGGQGAVQYDKGGDETAARAAAFGRAKELAGQNANAALRSLQEVAANNGTTGSSMDKGATAGAVNQARGGVNDFVREQLMSDLGRARNVADTTYQGDIAQRGQNLNTASALLNSITRAISGGSQLY